MFVLVCEGSVVFARGSQAEARSEVTFVVVRGGFFLAGEYLGRTFDQSFPA